MITHPHPHPRIFFTVFIRAPSTFSISLLWLRPDSKRRQLSVEDPDGRVLSPVMGYLPAEALRKIPDKGWPEGSCGSPREEEDRPLRVKMSDVRNLKGFSRKLFQRFPLVLYTFSLHRPYAEYIVMTREKAFLVLHRRALLLMPRSLLLAPVLGIVSPLETIQTTV